MLRALRLRLRSTLLWLLLLLGVLRMLLSFRCVVFVVLHCRPSWCACPVFGLAESRVESGAPSFADNPTRLTLHFARGPGFAGLAWTGDLVIRRG